MHLRFIVVVGLLGCVPAVVLGQAAPQISFRIVETDPASRSTLGGRQAFYLHIEYESDVPVRFRGWAYTEGAPADVPAATNPAPPYPAGRGEAVVWLAFQDEARIDEVRVTAMDEQWRKLATVSHALDMRWNGVMPRRNREPADWAGRLSDAQQHMASTTVTQVSTGWDAFVDGMLTSVMSLSIPAYLILQASMLLGYRGGWRKAAMVPLAGMIPLVLYTLVALMAGSNLWPLMLLFLTPLACGYLLVLWIVKLLIGRPTQYASGL